MCVCVYVYIFIYIFKSRINGECNNLNNKRWGAQVSPLQRLLPRQHEKFQIPLHEDLNDDPSGRKKMKRRKRSSDFN